MIRLTNSRVIWH